MINIVYDIECYPNVFMATFLEVHTGKIRTFEMSPWRNDTQAFVDFLEKCSKNFVRFIGFNNFFYDYPVIHEIYHILSVEPEVDGITVAVIAKEISDRIINTDYRDKWDNVIWPRDQIIPQLDLLRVHHFDNVAKMTSLKVLEFNMRSESVQDLPFHPDTPLTKEQTDIVRKYNAHDVRQTAKFLEKSREQIEFREELSRLYDRDFMNHNDTKIGKDYFIMELEKAGVRCFRKTDDGREPIQTWRDSIALNDVIFDYIQFERPEFNAVLDWLRRQTITETKAVFTEIDESTLGELVDYADLKKKNKKVANLNCVIDGFKFVFGTGGIHGSVESTIVTADNDFAIIDLDVTSYYPSIAIVNNVFPAHLGHKFVEIYSRLKEDRIRHKKGTAPNAMLKLALNGVYGDSNNVYSPFYDPQYTMTITVNGQLMLCMLAEELLKLKGVSLVQINTDGLTITAPRSLDFSHVAVEWMELTGLNLEEARYSRMFIRDVNNYIAEYEDGSVKRKGAYEYDLEWHQNHSQLVVPKAAEAALVRGQSIGEFLRQHNDQHDFMLRTKVPRSSRLELRSDETVEQLQNVTRYYVAENGGKLIKIMPPLRKNPDKEREISINKDWTVKPLNELNDVDDIDLSYYATEAEKLVLPLIRGRMKEMLS